MKPLPCAAMSRRGVDEGSFFLCNSMFFTSQKATWVQPDSSANSYTTVLLQYPHLIHKTDISVTFFFREFGSYLNQSGVVYSF